MGESYYPACEDCRRSTGMNCGKHGHAYIIEGGSTLPLLAERQYAYDRIAALIAERDAAQSKIAGANMVAKQMMDRLDGTQTALTEARRVLREVEWAFDNGYDSEDACALCHQPRSTGHLSDCALAAVLAQEEK